MEDMLILVIYLNSVEKKRKKKLKKGKKSMKIYGEYWLILIRKWN